MGIEKALGNGQDSRLNNRFAGSQHRFAGTPGSGHNGHLPESFHEHTSEQGVNIDVGSGLTFPHEGIMRTNHFLCLAFLAAALQTAQTVPAKAQSSGDIASAAKSAANMLTSAAKDKLLVKDLLGASVTGPNGQTIGTVENLVVIPGGRVVAAIIATKAQDTGRIPVPFAAVKVTNSAGKLGLTLPVGLSELKGMKEVQALAGAIPGVN